MTLVGRDENQMFFPSIEKDTQMRLKSTSDIVERRARYRKTCDSQAKPVYTLK